MSESPSSYAAKACVAWRLERKRNGEKRDLPARFLSNAKNACERQGTAKELDEETGLYYYGARYFDPKYSMWISTDPALGEYIPQAPINDEAKKNNQNLPGMGGIFNHINSNLYHYAGNNPVKYVDPDGRKFDTSSLTNDELQRFNMAIQELKKTERGNYVITILENTPTLFIIKHNNNGNNSYLPNENVINWDSNKFLSASFDIINGDVLRKGIIDPITLLMHELGHAYQDTTNIFQNVTDPIEIENMNIKENENPVAQERDNFIRTNYFDFLFPFKKTLNTFIKEQK